MNCEVSSKKNHVNLHTRYCLQFQEDHKFHRINLNTLHWLGWSYALLQWGYHLYADNSKSVLGVRFSARTLQPFVQVQLDTPQTPRLKLSQVGTWSLSLHTECVLLNRTGPKPKNALATLAKSDAKYPSLHFFLSPSLSSPSGFHLIMHTCSWNLFFIPFPQSKSSFPGRDAVAPDQSPCFRSYL